MVPAQSGSDENPLPGLQLTVSSCKDTNPRTLPSWPHLNLFTSQSPHLQYDHIEEQGFNIWTWERHMQPTAAGVLITFCLSGETCSVSPWRMRLAVGFFTNAFSCWVSSFVFPVFYVFLLWKDAGFCQMPFLHLLNILLQFFLFLYDWW